MGAAPERTPGRELRAQLARARGRDLHAGFIGVSVAVEVAVWGVLRDAVQPGAISPA